MINIIGGKPGHGKSYELVRKVKQALLRGRLVFCDMPIYVKKGGEILRPAILTRDMLRNFRFPIGCLIAINEGGSWFNSRNYKDKLKENENAFTDDDFIIFTQGRHIDIDMIIVAQDIGMLDINIRRVCEVYWETIRTPGAEFWYDKLKLPPLWFTLWGYYSESDYNNPEHPRDEPIKVRHRFSKKIARCYDTKYQRNILARRPQTVYNFWTLEHYEAPTTFFELITKKKKDDIV